MAPSDCNKRAVAFAVIPCADAENGPTASDIEEVETGYFVQDTEDLGIWLQEGGLYALHAPNWDGRMIFLGESPTGVDADWHDCPLDVYCLVTCPVREATHWARMISEERKAELDEYNRIYQLNEEVFEDELQELRETGSLYA